MNTYNYTIVIILLIVFYQLNNIALYSQSCESCRSKNYQYIGCELDASGFPHKTHKCTNNPLSQSDNFRPWKKCLANHVPYLEYDQSGCPFSRIFWGTHGNNPEPDDIIFDLDVTEAQIEVAISMWIDICDPKNNIDCDDCDLKIFWARDAVYMGAYPESLAVTHQTTKTTAGVNQCQTDCNDNYIAINATDRFLDCDVSKGEYPPDYHFFYTNLSLTNKGHYYSFPTVLEHEIGHWLGFDDQTECGDLNGIMAQSLPDETDKSISYDDRCMFMLLYCCDALTGINNENSNDGYELLIQPNPTNHEVNFVYYLSKASQIKLNIFDNLGRSVKCLVDSKILEAGKYSVKMDLNNFSNGIYHCILETNDIKIIKQFIINK